ncbi:pentatricopeptide repeat-containing protein [Iris pallida]|uniref:Pentatricopeptide repeat-containing protein n=1 Tax=Iris pallida TaxID=29817 RepID=A0AAX6F7A7_IRIPA|nr:pentatricopeptide repeat-containing protein [Iris pallida]
MQTLSIFTPKVASLATPHIDSGMPTRRRMQSSVLGGSLVGIPSISCAASRRSRNGPLFNGKKCFLGGRPFALALALEQESAGEVVGEVLEPERVDVRALALRLQTAKTADHVEESLKNSAADLPLPVYSSIIRGFGNEKLLEPAFALVEWLKRKEEEDTGFGPNLYIYNSLLGAVKQAGKFELVDVVMEEMTRRGIVLNVVTYNTLMSVHLEQRRPKEVLRVLDDIKKNGLSPSPVTYSTILLAYRELEDAGGAIEFYVKLREEYERGEIDGSEEYDWEEEFVKLKNFTARICYLVLRRYLVNEVDPSATVFRILSCMDKAQLKPGRAECERLIWACTREGHYTVARELYGRIRETEAGISLSVCNHVIWLMGKAKKWWAALEVYEDLLDKGPKPNNLSYELIISHFNVLLTAARRKGIWRWGVRLINKMVDKGLRPGTREWNAVLVACSKASETTTAVQIFRRMVEQGEKPTILSYGALLSALEKGKLYDEALRVWEHMTRVGVQPNLYAYTILASVYIGKGKYEMADSILREMAERKIEPTVVTFNAIITGCAKKQMGGAAFEWFHRMRVWNVKPNEITYDMLVEALAGDGKPRLAYEMYLRARKEGLQLSSKSYDVVVESCRAYSTSLDIVALGQRPTEKKKKGLKIRKNLTEFCNLADLPRRGKPFDKSEIYTSQMKES